VELGALGFLQPNRARPALAYGALLAASAEEQPRQLAFDLYAGAAVTTRVLAQQHTEILAREAHPESAAALGIVAESSEQLLARELTRSERREVDLVIANPPRKDPACGAGRALETDALRRRVTWRPRP
jgi:tRNA/tmRNA/rRNA uracil-C5-methylase (TrmA/RlmC/RlmD family)